MSGEARRIQIKGPLRCPWCHDRIELERSWCACSRCLARHHDECWGENRKCGACLGGSKLVPEERRAPVAPAGVDFGASSHSVTGFWKGRIDTGVGAAHIDLDLVQAGVEFSGYYFRGSARGHVRYGRVSGLRVSFEVATGDDEIWYEGHLAGQNRIAGTWRLDDENTGDFELRRVGRA